MAGEFAKNFYADLADVVVLRASHRNAPSSPAVQNDFVGHSTAEDGAWQTAVRSFASGSGIPLVGGIEVVQEHLGKADGFDARSSALEEHRGHRHDAEYLEDHLRHRIFPSIPVLRLLQLLVLELLMLAQLE